MDDVEDEQREYTRLLKEINTEANEVIKSVNKEEDETAKTMLITMFANEAFQKGLNLGLNKK